jgi:hypothetical protein
MLLLSRFKKKIIWGNQLFVWFQLMIYISHGSKKWLEKIKALKNDYFTEKSTKSVEKVYTLALDMTF